MKKVKPGNQGLIIWAIDPFQEVSVLQTRTAEAAENWAEKAGALIEPVFVLSADQSVATVLKRTRIRGLVPTRLIVKHDASTGDVVKSLLKYALKTKAQAIVVGTQNKSALDRFFLGSFTETLFHLSGIPVLAVGPGVKAVSKKGPILFPTDFSEKSEKAFEQVILVAQSYKTSLILHHCVQNPMTPLLQSGALLSAGGWMPEPDYLENEISKAQDLAKQWVSLAKRKGVNAQVLIEAPNGDVALAILAAAKKHKAQLIAMAAQRGPFSAALIGSTTRHVARQMSCPVLVYRKP